MKTANKPSKRSPITEPTGDPYLDARGAWLERYGSYVQQAYNWRLLAILEAIGLVAAVVGLIYLAGQTKFVPYVVAIDKVGTAIAVHPADRASSVDPRVVRAQLANFLVNARTVATDRLMDLQNINAAYDYVAGDSPARGYLDSWYPDKDHSPFDRARKETDQIAVNAILPITATSYQMQWTETIRDLKGRQTSQQVWEGTATIAFHPPEDEATVLKNPLGLYITELNWSKKL